MENTLFFKKLYLSTLTPFELLAFSKQNEILFKKRESDFSYLNYWKESICKNASDEAFYKYCLFNNLGIADISLMTSLPEDTAEKIDFPLWINTLEEVLNNVPQTFARNNGDMEEKAFSQFFVPFIHFFSGRLEQNLKSIHVAFDQNVMDQLNQALYRELFELSHLVLLKEFSKYKNEVENQDAANGIEDYYYEKFILALLSDKFHNLFLDYPMMARKLAVKTERFLKFITNLFEKFKSDKAEIEYYFETKLGKISELHLNSGDQHNGESTIIFEFDNAYKIVYKPTNVAVTFAYNQFLDWVNKNLGEELKSFKVIDKDTYGWLEFVKHSECETNEDIKLYYERAGILVGVAYFLNARDYHFENVIASGNCPVLIDHETTILPTIKLFHTQTYTEEDENIVGTILESLLLPIKNQNVPVYACGFGSSVQLEYNCTVQRIENINKDKMQKVHEMVYRNLYKSNKPKLNNKIENLIDYQLEFKTGFDKIYKLILENKNFLLSKNSPFEHFRDLKIRFINRQTGVYFKILRLLNSPEYLADATNYGIKLELLARAYAAIGNWSPILGSEREQMLLGDIPVFYLNTLSENLDLGNGQIVDLLESNALESVNSKIKKADLADYQHQVNLIEGAITL
ncbi:type 2 lantibiotic biosynthesis protein LanM [Flavobacterium sp. 270]|uniref:type 2 lanthipeptide synthetase LanM n=1 Tax=Flavobacterium sp. 270 TaxID=2512114 RepID=UPI001066B071|nr:type 2 lanthipeptide synthetase LanM [Flavobacterium sp. 270]TDW51696.1 type 2 lantibiotic biosynthesis protein LanM [Flavobacterium sp. 270]